MWWTELHAQAEGLRQLEPCVDPRARVASTALLKGAVRIEAGAIICHGACIEGPVVIGRRCLVGNHAMIRGATRIGDGTRIGFGAEIKHARIGAGVSIGPQCYVADSVVEDDVYLGAQVRTSNHRLDRRTVSVVVDGRRIDTGLEKLGCHVGARASLGIQVIVLPGRVIAPDTTYAPRATVERNLPSGRYRIAQALESF